MPPTEAKIESPILNQNEELPTEKKYTLEDKTTTINSSEETKTNLFRERLKQLNPFNKGIKTQLLTLILPTVLIPVFIIGDISYSKIYYAEQDRIKTQLKNQALVGGEIAESLLDDATDIPFILSSDPFIVKAVDEASQKVEAQKLNQLSIPELEQKFASTKLLEINPILNDYLKSIVQRGQVAEIFFTDKHGYNVASSHLTSDFVQSDETWWQEGKKEGQWLSPPNYDESAQTFSIDLIKSIKEPKTGEFLGVIKFVIPTTRFGRLDTYLEGFGLKNSQQIQLVSPNDGKAFETVSQGDKNKEEETVIGGETITDVAKILLNTKPENQDIEKATQEITQKYDTLQNFKASIHTHEDEDSVVVSSFAYQGKEYYLAVIKDTNWVAIASIDSLEIETIANELIGSLVIISILLVIVATIIIILISDQLSKPLINLARTTEEAATGNLEVMATPEGSIETQTLANNFNNLINRAKQLLNDQIESVAAIQTTKQDLEILAQDQQLKNETIQQELFQLLTDVEGASSGDLTVRAEISAGEIGIVADFFNSIVENLRDIVIQVKETTEEVNNSLGQDEQAMEKITKEATKQSKKIERMLNFVEEMTQSIQQVAKNTQSVAEVAKKASRTAQTGGVTIDKTVKSIVQLRDTVGETAKKVKRLGESSQQISKVISLINQIALQTNLLAINASIEAARAGEEGRGFAVVAEEVGQLAAQSAEATKEIEKIVESIQKETTEVVEAMEEGTSQVVEGTNLVAQAKRNFGEIVSVSRQIDQLLQSISGATVSQTKTSEMVASLMKDIVKVSQESSESSRQVTVSLQKTVETARQLQTSVETFKVTEEE